MALQTSTDGEKPARGYENPSDDNKESPDEKPTADDIKDTSIEMYPNGKGDNEKTSTAEAASTNKSAKWYQPASIRHNVRPANIRRNAEGFADKHPRRTILLIVIGVLLICLLMCIVTGVIVSKSTSRDVSEGSSRTDEIQIGLQTMEQKLNTSGLYKLERSGPVEKSMYVLPGDRLILHCDVVGPLATVFSWTKANNCNTYDVYQSIVVTNEAYSGHAGKYTCTAVGPTGDELTQTINVHYNDTTRTVHWSEKCTFEVAGEFCGWTQGTPYYVAWNRKAQSSSDTDRGIYYITTQRTLSLSDTSAMLRSHLLPANQELCFTMDYLNYLSTLTLFTQDTCTKKQTEIFQQPVSTRFWKNGTLTVNATSVPNDYYILITATGQYSSSLVYLDNLTFNQCPDLTE